MLRSVWAPHRPVPMRTSADLGMRFGPAALSLIVSGVLHAAPAAAQPSIGSADVAVDLFTHSRNIAVRQRPRPDFEAVGLRAGAFLVYPKVELSGEFDDNIYALDADETSDTILHLRPELAIESDWSRNFATVFARASINRHRKFRSEDRDEYGLGVLARADVNRLSNLRLGAEFNAGFEPRTSLNAPSGSVRPIALDTTTAFAAAAFTNGQMKLTGRADLRRLDYADGAEASGRVIKQDQRDREVSSLMGRVEFAASPDAALFVQVTGNRRDYGRADALVDPARDSRGLEALFGAGFEVGALVRGEIAVGSIRQDFDNPDYADTVRFGGRAQLEYFPSQLTTLTFGAGRTVEDAVARGAGGFVSTSGSVSIDHELLRNVILNARLTYSSDRYQGLDRDDARTAASLGATYLVNRNLGVSASVSSQRVSSDGVDRVRDFRVNRLAVALVTQL